MRYLVVVGLILSPLLAEAASYIAIAGEGRTPVSPVMEMPAEYVGVSVFIRSDAKDAAKRIDEVNETRASLNKAVAANPNLQLQWTRSSYSAEDGSYKLSSYGADARSQLFVLGKLGPGSIDTVTKQIIAAIKAVEPEGDANIRTGDTSLGVTDPERFRKTLLDMVKASITDTKAALGGSSVEVSGLESPVQVVQKNDREITLFLNYRLTVKK